MTFMLFLTSLQSQREMESASSSSLEVVIMPNFRTDGPAAIVRHRLNAYHSKDSKQQETFQSCVARRGTSEDIRCDSLYITLCRNGNLRLDLNEPPLQAITEKKDQQVQPKQR